MNKDRRRKVTIKTMLLIPMLVVNLVIVVIFLFAIQISDILFRIRQSEVSAVQRTAQIQGDLVQQALGDVNSVTQSMVYEIQRSVTSTMGAGADIAQEIAASTEEAARVLDLCLPHLVDALRLNAGTGAFVVLDASAMHTGGGFEGPYAASLYFNDEDMSGMSVNNVDLMLYQGPKQVARDMGIPLDNQWAAELNIGSLYSRDFLLLPFEAAANNNATMTEQLGLWTPGYVRQDGREVLFYTIPLRDGSNRPYGVAGLEVSADYLKSRLGTAELGHAEAGFFAIAHFSDDAPLPDWGIAGGALASKIPADASLIDHSPLPEYGEDVWEITFDGHTSFVAVTSPIETSATGSVFRQGRWTLIVGVERGALFTEADQMLQFFVVALLIATAAGIFFSLFSAHLFVRPVTRLSGQLRDLDPDEGIALTKTNIREVDLLIDSIETLGDDLIETGHRTTMAIEMTEMPIGFLEINPERGRVYLTDFLFLLFAISKDGDSNFIPLLRWNEIFARLEKNRLPDEESAYLLDFLPGRAARWLRIRMAETSGRTFGIVIDATDDILEKKRLEIERDTDPLTGLLNRSAFLTQAALRLSAQPDKKGVMLFADLDNLKYVNDTYGHDFGDRYIRAAAGAFSLFGEAGGVVSRISGDEFAIFLYGGETREELGEIVSSTYSRMEQATIDLPGGAEMKVRCSMGFSWYPDDSGSLDQLLRYADFAMYETKRSVKGSIREFSIDSYLQNSYLVEKNEEFNQFIEQNLVYYALQPIVDIYSGTVFAYETLMRPKSPAFDSPFQVLQIARTQAKLYQIERMTMFNVMEWVSGHLDELGESKVFVNSIPSQQLSDKDLAELDSRYGHLLPRTVMEITEEEHSPKDLLVEKVRAMRRMGAGIAIDDYGSGYSNEANVLHLEPGYIKIDITLVTDIHMDENKQKLVKNIIGYAHPLGIKIIAEGIESAAEAEAMVRLGADYLQGFFLARPSPDITHVDPEVAALIRSFAARYRDRRSRNTQKEEV